MLSPRLSKAVARLVANKRVSLETRRTLYPHYLRYMAVNPPGHKSIPMVEKVTVYLAFVIGIMGPPTFIMYDVGKKRPRS